MNPNIEAKILVEHFIPVVYPFSTSSYLTGTEYKDVKFNSAVREAIYVAELLKPYNINYYTEVINEIKQFKISDFDIQGE